MARTPSSRDAALAWQWVIEYLASSDQIHPSILYDLIREAPVDLGKDAREMVTLRCLEFLFANHANEPASVVPKSKITFDPHETCENVLLSILKEAPVTDFKVNGPYLLRWNIHPFLLQKRASLPEPALKHLRDAIVDGTHPRASFLRKVGGLVHKNDENDGRTVDRGTDNNGTGSRVVAPEGSNSQLPFENENGMVGGDTHLKNVLPSKKKGHQLDDQHLAGDRPEDQGGVDDDDNHLNAKRFRTSASCAIKSGQQVVFPQSCNRSLENSQVEGLDEQRPPDNIHVNLTTIEGHDDLTYNDDFQRNQLDDVKNNKIPQSSPEDGARERNAVDEVIMVERRVSVGEQSLGDMAKGSGDNIRDTGGQADQLNQPNVVSMSQFPRGVTLEKSPGGTENLNQEDTSIKSSGLHHKKVDVAMEKGGFLSSQHTQRDVSGSDGTEINGCVKCSKGGQLLVCTADGCPLVVHEKCLSSSPKFDDNGNFYCPVCAYSHVVSEYLKAQHKATCAKKRLAAFIRKQPNRSHIQKHNNLERDHNEDHFYKTCESGDLGEGEPDQTINREHHGQPEKTRGDKQPKKPMSSRREKRRSNLLEKPACVVNVDERKTSVDESDEIMISKHPIGLGRRAKSEKQYTYPAAFQLKRKKVPWTAMEEKILKEGVEKFSNAGNGTMPWKKILEYGSSVFGDRTTIDLKDKWRNICKGSPKCK